MTEIKGPDFPTGGIIMGKVVLEVLMKLVEEEF